MPVTRQRSRSRADDGSRTPSTPSRASSSSTSTARQYSKPSSPQIGSVNLIGLKKFQRNILIGVSVGILFMGLITWAVRDDHLNLVGRKTVELQGLASKLEFVLRYQSLGLVWLMINTIIVANKRFLSGAADPLSGNERIVVKAKNVLTQSFEQFIMSMASQLILITYLSSNAILKVIPLMNIFFLLGRISFFLGYPNLRSTGFTLTFLPTVMAIVYCAFKFGRHVGIY